MFVTSCDSTAEEFDYEGLCKALEKLSDFEKRSNARVIESGVLKGVNMEDIKRAGERLILQDGCTGFFQKIVKNNELKADVHILSYCWCGDLIRSSFSSGILHLYLNYGTSGIYWTHLLGMLSGNFCVFTLSTCPPRYELNFSRIVIFQRSKLTSS